MAPISDIERQVFTDIYETYSGKLYGVCLHYVHDHETAEDLLHDSFIVIFSSLDSLREPSKLEPWMRSIVRNIAFKYLKDTQKTVVTDIESIPEPLFEETTAHFTEIPLDKLIEVVDTLPEQYGNVFKLSVLDGLSHKEISAVLGIAPHSSSSNLTRAKQMLRKVISKNWGILMTFCLCILAILFMIKPDISETFMAGTREIQLIPAGRQEILIAEIKNPADLKSLEFKNIHNGHTAAEEETHEYRDEVICHDISKKPEPSEDNIETREPTYESYDFFEEESENDRRVKRKIRFGLSGNVGNPADGRMKTQFAPQNQLPPIGSGINPPYTGGNISTSIIGPTPPEGVDKPGENQGTGNNEVGNTTIVKDKVIKYRHAMPVTVDVSLTYSFTDRWSIATGLRYTYLHSDINDLKGNWLHGQDIHYIGIPLKASWTFWKSYHFNAYISAGAAADLPVAAQKAGRKIDLPCQWSAGLGLGLQYDITPRVGIYIEPELNRYFENASKVETIRSERPVTFTLPLGIRFSL